MYVKTHFSPVFAGFLPTRAELPTNTGNMWYKLVACYVTRFWIQSEQVTSVDRIKKNGFSPFVSTFEPFQANRTYNLGLWDYTGAGNLQFWFHDFIANHFWDLMRPSKRSKHKCYSYWSEILYEQFHRLRTRFCSSLTKKAKICHFYCSVTFAVA